MGEPQIHGIFEGISDADLKIVVLHHPFDWLTEFDCNRIETRIYARLRFHIAWSPAQTKGRDSERTTLAIMSLSLRERATNVDMPEDPLYANSYNYVHLDFDTGKGIVFFVAGVIHEPNG